MTKKVKYAIIGCGSFGGMHIEALLQTKDIEITGLCDVHMDFVKEKNEKYSLGAKCYTDYNEMLSEVEADIVVVATADHAHKGATVAALKAGFNVLCEKPLCVNAKEAEALSLCAKKNNVFLMEAMWTRFIPAIICSQELVESGAIGDVRGIEAAFCYASSPEEEAKLRANDILYKE